MLTSTDDLPCKFALNIASLNALIVKSVTRWQVDSKVPESAQLIWLPPTSAGAYVFIASLSRTRRLAFPLRILSFLGRFDFPFL